MSSKSRSLKINALRVEIDKLENMLNNDLEYNYQLALETQIIDLRDQLKQLQDEDRYFNLTED